MEHPRILGVLLLSVFLIASRLPAEESALVAKYGFERLTDEPIKDLTGHGFNATDSFGDASWITTDLGPAVQMVHSKDRVEIPFAAFPGAKGRVRLKIKPGSTAVDQTLFRVYSAASDGLTLALRKGKLKFSYYNRGMARSFAAESPEKLNGGDWLDVTVSWELGRMVSLQLDDGKVIEKEEPLAGGFGDSGKVSLGNDYAGGQPFLGAIASLEIYKDVIGGASNKGGIAAANGSSPSGAEALSFPEGDRITLENGLISLVFSRRLGIPISGKSLTGPTLPFLAADYTSEEWNLWELNLAKDYGRGENLTLHCRDSKTPPTLSLSKLGNRQLLEIKWADLPVGNTTGRAEVIVTVELPDGEAMSYWKISARSTAPEFAINEIHFPLVAFAPPSLDPARISFIVPYRWGLSLPDPFHLEKGKKLAAPEFKGVYPSNLHMQFFAYTGPEGQSTYCAAQDPDGYVKQYTWRAVPARRRVEMDVTHYPERRDAASYAMPYPVVIGSYQGDWFDAAQIYRKWAQLQPWCEKGPLSQRKDLPAWLLNADTAARLHTKAGRPLDSNVTGALEFEEAFPGPILASWYAWWQPDMAKTAMPTNDEGSAWASRTTELRPGIDGALKQLVQKQVYPFAYMNSLIFDQGKNPDAMAEQMKDAICVEKDGSYLLYNKESLPLWVMSRSSEKWQDYFAGLSAEAVRKGFCGIYMDSFGRGSVFDYGSRQNQPIAGGRAPTVGQLQMGTKVRESIRKVNPDAIILSEACTELFAGLVDANLLHYDVLDHGCPLWMAVYHDYQVFFGRSYSDGADSTPLSFRQRIGTLFVNGGVLGRFFVSSAGDKTFPLADKDRSEFQFLSQLESFRRKDRPFLTYGAMLRPAILAPQPAMVNIHAKELNFPVAVVLTQSWKAPDGRACVFAVNTTDQIQTLTLSFDASEYGFPAGTTLALEQQTASASVSLGPVKAGPLIIPCTLEPAQVMAYLLKPL